MDNFIKLLNSISVTDNAGNKLDIHLAIKDICGILNNLPASGGKVFFIGNGGSAAIASHMATDFLKNKGVRALAFNDSSLLTCVSNDLGYEYVFQKPLEILSDKTDVIFSISSSGKSENIINAVKQAKRKGCYLVTLSGFSKRNPLRRLGDINFFVSSYKYGLVEVIHHYICHRIVDMTPENKKKNG